MGLDRKKDGKSQLTDVFCGPYTEEFDLRDRNSAFGKQQWDHKIS